MGLIFLSEGKRERREADALGSTARTRSQAAGAVALVGAARPVLTGKGIDGILRKTRARACRCGRRIGVTSWPFESVMGS